MEPSSSLALSLKPKIAYRSLNFPALRKKQTTLPSLAYAGIPYQVFGERSGAVALMSSWSRLAMSPQDRGAHGGFPIRLVLQLSGARFHRGFFLGRESFFFVGALGGLLLAFLRCGVHRSPFVRSTTCAKRSSRCSHLLMPSKA